MDGWFRCISYWNSPFSGDHVSFRECSVSVWWPRGCPINVRRWYLDVDVEIWQLLSGGILTTKKRSRFVPLTSLRLLFRGVKKYIYYPGIQGQWYWEFHSAITWQYHLGVPNLYPLKKETRESTIVLPSRKFAQGNGTLRYHKNSNRWVSFISFLFPYVYIYNIIYLFHAYIYTSI